MLYHLMVSIVVIHIVDNHQLSLVAHPTHPTHPTYPTYPSHRLCSHEPPSPHEVSHIHLEDRHVIHKRNTDQPLRIKVFYDSSVRRIPIEKFMIINNTVLPQALDYWQKALNVKPLHVPIRLNRKCPNNQAFFPNSDPPHQYCVDRCENITTCGEVIVPEDHLEVCRVCDINGRKCKIFSENNNWPEIGNGIKDTDFVFYVSAMQTDRCNKGHTVAYAAHCQQEAALDRPIAGHANLCPNSISTKPQDLETLLSTVKHEILHALGFSVSLYAYFRDKNGEPLSSRGRNGKPVISRNLKAPQWSDNIIRQIDRLDWKVRNGSVRKTIHMIVTPKVVEEVRKHFNCSELEGAELEDQGEDGTHLTHWEKRVFENEAMTGTHTQNPVYSRITLALMEDTGWYIPNYDMAQPLEWGKNLGCDFAQKSCKHWIDFRRSRGDSIHPFCDKVKRDPLETECTDNRDAVALCNLMEYSSDLLPKFQNFDYIPSVINRDDTSRYGGSVNLADFCPYIQEFTWKLNDVVVRGSKCLYQENNPIPDKNFALEYYGSNSKCFNHNHQMWEERNCHQYKCDDGLLHVLILNQTYTCYYANQPLKVQLYANDWLHIGTIICPPCQQVCQQCTSEMTTNEIRKIEKNIKSYKRHYLKCCSDRLNTPNDISVICLIVLSFIIHVHNQSRPII
ncbi:leishmanolysin-like peptidase isoform X2 [Oppia nitens]|uniref:leishmanolysin-like peptidase isoform X2 n=1 Tax=Oppia nitens TaxID=1686743 RepID=UPI0023DB7A93|nr:leishmanolysin-like peptidase isoform X2 [Oppia nitens]